MPKKIDEFVEATKPSYRSRVISISMALALSRDQDKRQCRDERRQSRRDSEMIGVTP